LQTVVRGRDRERPRGASIIRRFGWWLALISAGALTLRIVVIVISSNEAVGGDGFSYSYEANRNAAGQWFIAALSGKPAAIHPPIWSLILTGWAELGQHSVFRQQLLASIIGTCTVAVVGLAGRRIAGDRVGLVAAAIAAVYAGLWLYERALLSETFLFLVIAAMLIFAYSFHDQPSMARAAWLGVACGVMAMTRSEEILLFALLVVPLILTARGTSWRTRSSWLVLAAVLTLAVIAPWTIYNLGRFQKPIFLSTNAGAAAASANCDATYYGPYVGWYSLGRGCFPKHQSTDPSIAEGQEVHQGVRYVEGHLGRLPLVVFAREGRAFGFWNPFQQTYLDNRWQTVSPILGAKTSVWVYDLRLVSFWILLVPAIAGGVALRRRQILVYPLLVFFLTVAITVATAYGETRYRAAAEVPLVILAAVGVDSLLSRRWPSRGDEGSPDVDDHPAPERHQQMLDDLDADELTVR
jgi:4-amino-4-deoxy-L-arabinose transferase-like glycosyltransferase